MVYECHARTGMPWMKSAIVVSKVTLGCAFKNRLDMDAAMRLQGNLFLIMLTLLEPNQPTLTHECKSRSHLWLLLPD